MKSIKYILSFAVIFVLFMSCQNKDQDIAYSCPMECEGNKVYHEAGTCPVCKMDLEPVTEKILADEISEMSIFNLTSKWKTEENQEIELKDLKGKTLVMVMVYTSCQAACPRLVADMRNIEKVIPKELMKDIRFVLVSIDPKTDTPEKLKAFAIENEMDGEQWTFLNGSEASVREFANVLAVKYKQISPMDFSHSNIISVFNPKGEMVHQQEGLGVDNKETVKVIIETSKNN